MSLIDIVVKATKANTGAGTFFYAKVKSPNDIPSVPAVTGDTSPAFAGDVDAFLAANATCGGDNSLNRMLKNKVKKCTQCQKPNAFTLTTCNQCGRTLSDISVTYTNNVFTSFIFGIAKGPFPFSISLRFQADDVLVFDDLLALAPCHLNVIPTRQYIPDWRYLLRRPAEGLAVTTAMHSACRSVAQSQFLADSKWRAMFVRPSVTDEDILAHVASGFNYPPSQYQLHTQFMLPLLMPFQYYQYKVGVHFTYKRFFPSAYVRAVLTALLQPGAPVLSDCFLQDDTSVDDLTREIKRLFAIDYDEMHSAFYKDFATHQERFALYTPQTFEGVIVDNAMYVPWGDGGGETTTSPQDIAAIVAGDKAALQSYGRPYGPGSRPTGSYYSLTKKPEDLIQW